MIARTPRLRLESVSAGGEQSPKLEALSPIEYPDDLNDEDNYHGHLGGTRHDKTDMDRMGKVQELRVRANFPASRYYR